MPTSWVAQPQTIAEGDRPWAMGFERVFGFISSYGDVHMSEAVQRFPQLDSLSDEGLRTSEGRMNTHKPANAYPQPGLGESPGVSVVKCGRINNPSGASTTSSPQNSRTSTLHLRNMHIDLVIDKPAWNPIRCPPASRLGPWLFRPAQSALHTDSQSWHNVRI